MQRFFRIRNLKFLLLKEVCHDITSSLAAPENGANYIALLSGAKLLL